MTAYTFDKVARSERYFTASIFSHILMANEFEGLRLLFEKIFGEERCELLKGEFEVVTELEPLRDGSVVNEDIKKIFKTEGRGAVPDLFLRWADIALVIEAKFFTSPALDDIKAQLKNQKDVIELIKSKTAYKNMDINYGILILSDELEESAADADIKILTWQNVVEWFKKSLESKGKKDIAYCLQVLSLAIDRARDEIKVNKINFNTVKFDELIKSINEYIESGKIYIGFKGGKKELFESSLKSLENRRHYKISDTKWSDNWITIDVFLKRIIQLKHLPE